MTTADELRNQAQQLLDKATALDTPLTEADVKQMYAERRYAEIVQAKEDGRLKDYLESTTTDDVFPEGA